jgi:predicted amidohydrolase
MRQVQLVSVIQFAPAVDVRQNIKRAKQMIFEAATKDAKIILLPELCLGRFQFKNGPFAYSIAQPYNGLYSEIFKNISIKHNCYIVFGYTRLNNDAITNSCCVVGPSGNICNYDKRNLRGNDEIWYSAGDNLSPIVNTPWGRIGLMIGNDITNCDRNGNYFYSPGCVDIMCLLTDNADGGDNNFPKTDYFDLIDKLDLKLLMISGYGESCIIDDKHKVWTYGMYFAQPSVVGGALVLD